MQKIPSTLKVGAVHAIVLHIFQYGYSAGGTELRLLLLANGGWHIHKGAVTSEIEREFSAGRMYIGNPVRVMGNEPSAALRRAASEIVTDAKSDKSGWASLHE